MEPLKYSTSPFAPINILRRQYQQARYEIGQANRGVGTIEEAMRRFSHARSALLGFMVKMRSGV